MYKVNAKAVFGPKDNFQTTQIERRELQSDDVLIEIKYAGICHSDMNIVHILLKLAFLEQ